MSAVYIAGEANSIVQGQYSQRAVLEVKLTVEGVEHVIRAPASCRSFVHPVGGMRVTRQDIDVFEYAASNGERHFFHIPYSCGLADASVSLTSTSYVTQYVVAETPELLVRERRAIPAEDPGSQGSSVVLLSKNVAKEGSATNVVPSTDLIRGLQSGISADQRYLQSVSTFELPVKLDHLPHAVRERLAAAKEPLILDETRKLLVPLFRQLPSSYYVPGDLRYWQSQMSAAYSSERKEFLTNPTTAKRGERVYYFVPKARDCGGLANVPCRTYEYSYRLRNVVTDFPRPIYDPTYGILYVPVNMGVTYRSKVRGKAVARPISAWTI